VQEAGTANRPRQEDWQTEDNLVQTLRKPCRVRHSYAVHVSFA